MLYLVAIFIIYLGYLYFTGQDLPENVNDIIEQGTDIIEQGTEIIEEQIDKVVKDKKGK